MREVGIDMPAQKPKILNVDTLQAFDVCITMGCGDTCPAFPGKRYLGWKQDDRAGRGVEAVRPIRDEINALVEGLIVEIALGSSAERRSCSGHCQLRARAAEYH